MPALCLFQGLSGVARGGQQQQQFATQRPSASICSVYLGIGNAGGKQGRGNQPPYRRCGPDTEIQYRPRNPHELLKVARLQSEFCTKDFF